MSADLFAAFEDFSQPPQPSQSSNTPSSFQPPSFHAPAQRQSFVTPPGAFNQWHVQPTPQKNAQDADDDGWGDFEVASPTSAAIPTTSVSPPQIPDPQPTRIVRASTMELISNSLIGMEDASSKPNNTSTQWQPQQSWHSQPSSTIKHAKSRSVNADPNILFDADDFDGEQGDGGSDDDDGEFGEFETVSSNSPPRPTWSTATPPISSTTKTSVQKASDLLLDLDMNGPIMAHNQTSHISSFSNADAFAGMDFFSTPSSSNFTSQKQDMSSGAQNLPPTDNKSPADNLSFYDWDAFEDTPEGPMKSPKTKKATVISKPAVIKKPATVKKSVAANKPAMTTKPAAVEPSVTPEETSWDWEAADPPEEVNIKAKANKSAKVTQQDVNSHDPWNWEPDNTTAEANVDILQDTTLPPVNIPPPSIILSAFPQLFDQANEFLYKPIAGQTASAKKRILSDPKVHAFLRGYLTIATVAARVIGGRKVRWHRDRFLAQSMSISAAGSKGMKLAGVDKTQAVREDREAADVVSNWKSHVGRLRSTVATANSTTKDGGEQLKIPEINDSIQAHTVKDVPTAAKACVICGLKRNERISKVDFEVEDSFGEWWVDHWGHAACKRFWLHHENTLRQR